MSRKRKRTKAQKRLKRLTVAWLRSLDGTHAPSTIATWENYCDAHFVPFFGGADGLTRKRCAAYIKERLTQVTAATVKKERTALLSFLAWGLVNNKLKAPDWADERPNDPSLLEQWAHDVANAMVPRLPKRARGVPYHQRRRVAAFEVSPQQIRTFLRWLPEWSDCARVARFPIRARFILAYETSLRPSTLDRLEVPRHYRIGADRLHLTADTDKIRFPRDVPITKRARHVLDYLLRALEREHGAPHKGPIFGHHDYRNHVRAAAAKALPPELAGRFAGAHLRSARITHLLEVGANIPGVQHAAGHKHMSTTARYVKPSFRAALEALGEQKSA